MRLRYFFRVLAFFAWAARCSHFGGTPDGPDRYLPELFEGREHGVDDRLHGFGQLGGDFPQRVGQSIEGFAGLLHLLVIGERHAAS